VIVAERDTVTLEGELVEVVSEDEGVDEDAVVVAVGVMDVSVNIDVDDADDETDGEEVEDTDEVVIDEVDEGEREEKNELREVPMKLDF